MAESFEEIAENFEFLDDWEDRYRYVIEIGKQMTPLADERRTDAAKVEGCASQVWLIPELRQGPDGMRLHFEGDSDAMIVRGLIAILLALYSGLGARAVLAVDAPAELARLGLDEHLSSQRSNGLKAMVERIRTLSERSIAA